MDSKKIYLLTNNLVGSFFVIAHSIEEALSLGSISSPVDEDLTINPHAYTSTEVDYEIGFHHSIFRLLASPDVGRVGHYKDDKFHINVTYGCLKYCAWMWCDPYYAESKVTGKIYGPFANKSEAIFSFPILSGEGMESFLLTKRWITNE